MAGSARAGIGFRARQVKEAVWVPHQPGGALGDLSRGTFGSVLGEFGERLLVIVGGVGGPVLVGRNTTDQGHARDAVGHLQRTGQGVRAPGGVPHDREPCRLEPIRQLQHVDRPVEDCPAGARIGRAVARSVDRDQTDPCPSGRQGVRSEQARARGAVTQEDRVAVRVTPEGVCQLSTISQRALGVGYRRVAGAHLTTILEHRLARQPPTQSASSPRWGAVTALRSPAMLRAQGSRALWFSGEAVPSQLQPSTYFESAETAVATLVPETELRWSDLHASGKDGTPVPADHPRASRRSRATPHAHQLRQAFCRWAPEDALRPFLQ